MSPGIAIDAAPYNKSKGGKHEMRPEKKYFVEEVNTHLDKSDYVYLAELRNITVDEIAELRGQLSEHDAEFHVVKNTIFNVSLQLAKGAGPDDERAPQRSRPRSLSVVTTHPVLLRSWQVLQGQGKGRSQGRHP